MELRERHPLRPVDFSTDCASSGVGSKNLGVRTSTLSRRAFLCLTLAVTLAIPIPGLAADEEPTTTLPQSTTTTSTVLEETTTTMGPGSTTTTVGSTTTTVGTSTTTVENEDPSENDADTDLTEPVDIDDPLVDDPLKGVNPEDVEELPLPSIRFPLVGRASFRSTYGQPRDGGSRLHMGTDIIADRGTPVVAVAAGRVVRLGIGEDAGQYIVVRHNDGWSSVYVHLNNDSPGTDNGLARGYGPGIEVGARVRAGTLLGYVGDSGNAEDTTPHLHFELHQPDGFRPDPYPALRAARRVRTPSVLRTVDYRDVETVNAGLLGHIDPGTGFNAGLSVVDGHAYVGTWGNHERCPGTGIRILDVSDPSDPTLVGVIADHTEFPGTSTSAIWVGEIDTDTYSGRIGLVGLADCNDPLTEVDPHPVGLAIYDLEDPTNPHLLMLHEIGGAGITDLDVESSSAQLTVAAVVPVVRSHTPGIHETLLLFEVSDIGDLREVARWSPDVISGEYATSADVDALLSGSSVEWLDEHTLKARLRSFGDLTIDVSNPESPVDVTPQAVTWIMPDSASLSGGSLPEGYHGVHESFEAGALGVLEARLSDGVVLIRDAVGSDIARMVPGPAFDPQRWWLAPDGDDEFPLVWDVASVDGIVYFVDHHSGLWIFELAAEIGRISARSDID